MSTLHVFKYTKLSFGCNFSVDKLIQTPKNLFEKWERKSTTGEMIRLFHFCRYPGHPSGYEGKRKTRLRYLASLPIFAQNRFGSQSFMQWLLSVHPMHPIPYIILSRSCGLPAVWSWTVFFDLVTYFSRYRLMPCTNFFIVRFKPLTVYSNNIVGIKLKNFSFSLVIIIIKQKKIVTTTVTMAVQIIQTKTANNSEYEYGNV